MQKVDRLPQLARLQRNRVGAPYALREKGAGAPQTAPAAWPSKIGTLAREVQVEHGVSYKSYWVDEQAGKIFCLVDAPNAEAAHTGSASIRRGS